jgi:type IV secretory pathway TrbD component
MRPINKSLIRYQTILGVEKELFFFALLVSGIIPYSVRNWISLVIGAIIWFIFIFLLRQLCKKDPIYFKIICKSIGYQRFYAAKTPRWRRDGGYKARK